GGGGALGALAGAPRAHDADAGVLGRGPAIALRDSGRGASRNHAQGPHELMPLLEVVIRFINVFSAAMVAGGQLTVLWVIIPVKRELDLSLSVRIHQAMLGHQIDRFMRPFGILSILSALLILALGLFRLLQISGLSLGVESLGILGTLGVILTSRYGNVRTNRV